MSEPKLVSTRSVLTISAASLGALNGVISVPANAQAARETAPVEFRAPAQHSQYRIPQAPEYAPVRQGTPLEKPDVQYYEKVAKTREQAELKRQAAEHAAKRKAQIKANAEAQSRAVQSQSVQRQAAQTQITNQPQVYTQTTQTQLTTTQSQAVAQQVSPTFQQGVAQTRYPPATYGQTVAQPYSAATPQTLGGAPLTQTQTLQAPSYQASAIQTPSLQSQVYQTQAFQNPSVQSTNLHMQGVRTQPLQFPGYSASEVTTPPVSMATPEMAVPELVVQGGSLPNMAAPEIAMSIPSADVPAMQMPQAEFNGMNMPNVEMQSVSMPRMDVPSVNMPAVNMQNMSLPPVTAPAMAVSAPSMASGVVGSVASTGTSIATGAVKMVATAAATQVVSSGVTTSAGAAVSAASAVVGMGVSAAIPKRLPISKNDEQKMSFTNEDLMSASLGAGTEYQMPSQTVQPQYRPSIQPQSTSALRMQAVVKQELPSNHYQQRLVGNAIEVLPGDTLYTLSERYRVALRALVQTNDLYPPFALVEGSLIYLPPPNIHVVEAGETLYAISRRYNVDTRSLANMNGLPKPWTIYPGDEMILPSLARDSFGSASTAMVSEETRLKAVAKSYGPATPVVGRVATATLNTPPAEVSLQTQTPNAPSVSKELAADPAKTVVRDARLGRFDETVPVQPVYAAVDIDLPGKAKGFVWPVSGNVLEKFGTDQAGKKRDGLNISAKAGESIKAVSDGYVVYAGSELPGFGHLVLINHGGGWVSAYAHAEELLVQEGQAIRQGQVVAKVGETGSVDTPQLHFQLRKGKSPVDPMAHLSPKRAI